VDYYFLFKEQMNASSTRALIIDALSDFGTEMLVVLAAVIGVGLGFLIYRIGWRKVKGSHK